MSGTLPPPHRGTKHLPSTPVLVLRRRLGLSYRISSKDINYYIIIALIHMDILQGTLDLLILRALELEAIHGPGLSDRIAQVTRGTLTVKPGSLFPALR